MSEIIEAKTTTQGHKNVTSQVIATPFGDITVNIGVRGYKSSEGDQVFEPPTEQSANSTEQRQKPESRKHTLVTPAKPA